MAPIKTTEEELSQALINKKGNRKERKLFTSGFFGRLFFKDINKIINDGSKQKFTEEMLYSLDDQYLYKDYPNFKKYYDDNKEKYKEDFFHLHLRYTKKENIQRMVIYVFR